MTSLKKNLFTEEVKKYMEQRAKPKWKKKTIIYICASILVLIISCMVFYKCQEKPYKEVNNKSKATVQPLIDQKQTIIDSLLKSINLLVNSTNNSKQTLVIQREGFQNNYQDALEHSPDVCLPAIKTMYRMAMNIDSTNKTIIRRQDSTILNYSKVVGQYTDIMSLQKFQLQQKQDSIAQLQEEKKQSKKQQRRQKWKNAGEKILYSVFGFGTGYGTGKLLK